MAYTLLGCCLLTSINACSAFLIALSSWVWEGMAMHMIILVLWCAMACQQALNKASLFAWARALASHERIDRRKPDPQAPRTSILPPDALSVRVCVHYSSPATNPYQALALPIQVSRGCRPEEDEHVEARWLSTSACLSTKSSTSVSPQRAQPRAPSTVTPIVACVEVMLS